MAPFNEREAVALQELLKATQDRCKDLEQQIYVQRKSGEDARAALQRACEQQIDTLRKSLSRNADALRCCKESVPAVLTEAIHKAVESTLSKSVKHPQSAAQHEGLKEALEQLLQAALTPAHHGTKNGDVEHVPERSGFVHGTPKLKDASTRVTTELSAHLTGLVEQHLNPALQQKPTPEGETFEGHVAAAASDDKPSSSTAQSVQETKLQDTLAEVHNVRQQLQKCQQRLRQQESVHSTEVQDLQSRIDKLTQQLGQAQAAQTSQQASVQPAQQAVTSMVAVMEQSLGKLSSAVRSKDAEIAALQHAMQEQFTERNELRAQVSGLDGQLLRLQGSYSELEARLQLSEESQAQLNASQNRSLNTEARLQKRFRSRRLPASSSMHCSSSTSDSISSIASTQVSNPGHGQMHAAIPSLLSSSTQQTMQAAPGHLQHSQPGSNTVQPAGRFRKAQEHSRFKQSEISRKEAAVPAGTLQKHAVSQLTWLKGSSRAAGTLTPRLKGGLPQNRMPTDLVQFQWESGVSRRTNRR